MAKKVSSTYEEYGSLNVRRQRIMKVTVVIAVLSLFVTGFLATISGAPVVVETPGPQTTELPSLEFTQDFPLEETPTETL